MSNEISVALVCVQMRSGVEIWLEEARAASLKAAMLSQTPPRFVNIDEKVINVADVVGIFPAADMEASTNRKNGLWRCKVGAWHDRGAKCDCPDPAVAARNRAWAEAVKACGKCNNGLIDTPGGGVGHCACVDKLRVVK